MSNRFFWISRQESIKIFINLFSFSPQQIHTFASVKGGSAPRAPRRRAAPPARAFDCRIRHFCLHILKPVYFSQSPLTGNRAIAYSVPAISQPTLVWAEIPEKIPRPSGEIQFNCTVKASRGGKVGARHDRQCQTDATRHRTGALALLVQGLE